MNEVRPMRAEAETSGSWVAAGSGVPAMVPPKWKRFEADALTSTCPGATVRGLWATR